MHLKWDAAFHSLQQENAAINFEIIRVLILHSNRLLFFSMRYFWSNSMMQYACHFEQHFSQCRWEILNISAEMQNYHTYHTQNLWWSASDEAYLADSGTCTQTRWGWTCGRRKIWGQEFKWNSISMKKVVEKALQYVCVLSSIINSNLRCL